MQHLTYIQSILQAFTRYMMTGVRETFTEEEPEVPGRTPVCPTRDQIAHTYRRHGTPVSSVPNHLLPLSCYMSNLLTLAQTCRDVEHPGTRLLLHRSTPAAVLLVLLLRQIVVLLLLTPPLVVEVPVVLLTTQTAAVSQISRLRSYISRCR